MNTPTYIGIDLGSTNIKAAAYDSSMRRVAFKSTPVEYIRGGDTVEFDAEAFFERLAGLLRDIVSEAGSGANIKQIALTGQAETLVCLGADMRPLMNAISWMDERSVSECEQLSELFSPETVRDVTGQLSMLPTWPATKILWLKKNRPEIFSRTAYFVLLKDYVTYRLTGRLCADMSIATFSLYFDIYKKCYWQEMLDAIGISTAQLPQLVEPCTVAGSLTEEAAALTGINRSAAVNTGTLDHFSGMIGTGNISPGRVTLSTGTVMALAVMTRGDSGHGGKIAMHYGFLPDTRVMLPVAESGGVSLEWFRRTCMPGVSYDELNAVLNERSRTDIIFLPYIVGTNAPEFDAGATGVFHGLRQEHDAFDMARAVMEGVAFVLRKNCEAIKKAGTAVDSIIATGGGAKSELWCQIQADITGLPVLVPEESEAACLGAAMIAAVGSGSYKSLEEAASLCVRFNARYEPRGNYNEKYARFNRLYDAALSI